MVRSSSPFGSLRLAVDCVNFAFLAILFTLAAVCPGRVPNAPAAAADALRAAALYGGAILFVRALPAGSAAVFAHTAAVLALHSYFFAAVAGFQHVLVPGWMDDLLVSWEESLTGTELSVWMQRITNPYLTEWMMFAYVLYVPLLPAVAFFCYRSGGARGTLDYLLNLSLVNAVCYAGFILFPVASPLFHHPERFTIPLEGGFFAWWGEWMRANVHYPGGSLPSPHCAAGTVMMALLHRYHRAACRVMMPVFLTIYAATVYGRYHYAWDVAAGILAAALVVRTSPGAARLAAGMARAVRTAVLPRPVPVAESSGGKETRS